LNTEREIAANKQQISRKEPQNRATMFQGNLEALQKTIQKLLTKAKLMFKISLLFCKGV
jgi:hypothetical protein